MCGSSLREVKDWLYKCDKCGYLASGLQPGSGLGVPGLESLRRANFEALCDTIAELITPAGASMLEVGCSEGWFLEEASKRGMIVHGLEPSGVHAAVARGKGFSITTGYFPGDVAPDTSYDLIVFNDVFEHLPDVGAAMAECARILTPGGLLIINIPNSSGILYRAATLLDRAGWSSPLDRLWQRGFPSPHLSYFNPYNLTLLATRHASLRHISSLRLQSVCWRGLASRVRASHRGIRGLAMFLALFTAVPVLRALPPDIMVAIFRKPTQ